MKNDREFLNEMWDKISQIEYEKKEIKAAEIRNKKITAFNIAILSLIICAVSLFIIVNPKIEMTVFYIAATISLMAAYWFDKFISGGKNFYEN